MNKTLITTKLKGKRVLITGGLGFIGSNLAYQCLNMGADVTIFDSLDSYGGGNLYNIHSFKESITVINGDIRDFECLSRVVQKQDFIFHCAAYTSHSHSMRDPLSNIDVNCKGVLNLLEAVRQCAGKAKIIYVGTSTQVGKLQGTVADELHSEFPLDIYSANKMVAEKYMLIYYNAFGIKTTVVRLPNVFGPRACINTPAFGFVNYFIGLAMKKEPITIYGDGQQKRNFCYIEDAVDALLIAATDDKSDGQVFFAVHDTHYKVADVATMIIEVMGGTVAYIPWPAEKVAIEVGDALISNEKIKSILGWKPHYNISMGLKLTKEYYDVCLGKYLNEK